MRYFANPSTKVVRDAMSAGLIGCIVTPKQRLTIPPGARFCADNGVYGRGYPGDEKWWSWLCALPVERCLFAVAPDVVGNARATAIRSLPWLRRIRSLGVPAAFVAQDGLELMTPPWEAFDVLFIGGSTEWKLSEHARTLTTQAVERGKRVHMGRVNSLRRFKYAQEIGCWSADGTHITFGPSTRLLEVLKWTQAVREV